MFSSMQTLMSALNWYIVATLLPIVSIVMGPSHVNAQLGTAGMDFQNVKARLHNFCFTCYPLILFTWSNIFFFFFWKRRKKGKMKEGNELWKSKKKPLKLIGHLSWETYSLTPTAHKHTQLPTHQSSLSLVHNWHSFIYAVIKRVKHQSPRTSVFFFVFFFRLILQEKQFFFVFFFLQACLEVILLESLNRVASASTKMMEVVYWVCWFLIVKISHQSKRSLCSSISFPLEKLHEIFGSKRRKHANLTSFPAFAGLCILFIGDLFAPFLTVCGFFLV